MVMVVFTMIQNLQRHQELKELFQVFEIKTERVKSMLTYYPNSFKAM